MVRIENSGIASFDTAMRFCGEMRRFGIRPDVARETWTHELDHFYADPKRGRGGEFGYCIDIKLTGWLTYASFVAYYQPWGERDPEDLMSIATAPGLSDMSKQDERVFNSAWRSWRQKMQDEKIKAEEKTGDEKGSVNSLIAIPKKPDEDESEYLDKVKLVTIFSEKLKKYEGDGKLPHIENLINKDFSEIKRSSWLQVKQAYNEALTQFVHEKNTKPDTEFSQKPAKELHPDRRLNPQKFQTIS